jgi:hypothetical protein
MKKLNFASIILALIFSIPFFYSCFTGSFTTDPYFVNESRQKENVYHAPAMQNIPLLSDKNDFSFSGSLGYTSRHSGVDIHTAFVPAKHFGLLAGFRSYSQKEKSEDGKINSYELGAGYIKDNKNLHFELYGGIGGGSTTNSHFTGTSKLTFTNFFIQPTIAVQNPEKTVQFAFTGKLSHQNFRIADTSFTGEREPFVTNQFRIMAESPNRILWEPGLVLRAGWKNVLFNIGVSTLKDLSELNFAMDRCNYFVGIIFRGNATNKQTKSK